MFGGRNQDENLARLAAELKTFYKACPPGISKYQGKITMDRIRDPQTLYPKLKAKGAAARHLAPFALQLARSYLSPRIVALCECLVRFYNLIEAEGMFLSESAKVEMPILGQTLCELYSTLAIEAFERNERVWKITPKLHLTQHLLEWQCLYAGNPRFYWAYADEDLIGQMMECASSCHPRTLCGICMFKWITLTFSDQLADL